jgi:hypothetical protein
MAQYFLDSNQREKQRIDPMPHLFAAVSVADGL